MSDIVEQAIRDTTARRNEAKDALRELVAEMEAEERSSGELVEWAADIRMAENGVDLHERRLRMLRRQR